MFPFSLRRRSPLLDSRPSVRPSARSPSVYIKRGSTVESRTRPLVLFAPLYTWLRFSPTGPTLITSDHFCRELFTLFIEPSRRAVASERQPAIAVKRRSLAEGYSSASASALSTGERRGGEIVSILRFAWPKLGLAVFFYFSRYFERCVSRSPLGTAG